MEETWQKLWWRSDKGRPLHLFFHNFCHVSSITPVGFIQSLPNVQPIFGTRGGRHGSKRLEFRILGQKYKNCYPLPLFLHTFFHFPSITPVGFIQSLPNLQPIFGTRGGRHGSKRTMWSQPNLNVCLFSPPFPLSYSTVWRTSPSSAHSNQRRPVCRNTPSLTSSRCTL